MIKIFTDINHYNSNDRKFLVDILRPFLPFKRLDIYKINNNLISTFIGSPPMNIIECDIVLLPMNWNYYIETKQKEKADVLIKQSYISNKKILIYVGGDYYSQLPKSEHIIGMYTSPYKSKQDIYSILPLPVIINDPLTKLNLEKIKIRTLCTKPSVGFCGHVDSNYVVIIVKSLNLLNAIVLLALNSIIIPMLTISIII